MGSVPPALGKGKPAVQATLPDLLARTLAESVSCASVREARGPTPCSDRRVRSPPEVISYDPGVNEATGWRFALAKRIGAFTHPRTTRRS